MPLQEELAACAITAWYPHFRHVTFKTVLLELPQEFLDFLVADGVHLHEDSEALGKRVEDAYGSDDDWGSASASSAEERPQPPAFPELVAQMHSAIAKLGGCVVPKFTWSCPKDAVFMTLTQSLACRNPDEVLLLLKSSDRVAHDICHALEGDTDGALAGAGAATAGAAGDGSTSSGGSGGGQAGAAAGAGVRHVLALRRWHDLRPEREFRCFVRGHQLVGISQRDVTEYYPTLAGDKSVIQRRILDFHQHHIQGRFPLVDYTYDVYVAATADAVKLVDFNPVGGTTAPLLFTWEELPFRDSLAVAAEAAAAAAAREEGAAACGSGGSSAAGAAAAGAGRAGEAEEGCTACGSREGAAAEEGKAGPAGAGAGTPADIGYLQQLRRVQVLSLGGAGGSSGASADAGLPSNALPQGEPQQGEQQPGAQQGEQQQEQPAPARQQQQGEEAPGPLLCAFRIIEGPVPMRPHKLAYGVPFDFVDESEGSALDALRQQLEGAGAEDLWASLRAQAA